MHSRDVQIILAIVEDEEFWLTLWRQPNFLITYAADVFHVTRKTVLRCETWKQPQYRLRRCSNISSRDAFVLSLLLCSSSRNAANYKSDSHHNDGPLDRSSRSFPH